MINRIYYLIPTLFLALTSLAQVKVNPANFEKEFQTKLILAKDGETIELPEGNFSIKGTLSLDAKNNITIIGKGMDKTFLSFKNQSEGAEGLKITNSQSITMQGFTLQDSKGDLIKAQKTNGITFREVKAEWTGKPKKTNGSYAFYPVNCDNVLIEKCVAIGASDAGIYVGQSRNIIVRNCTAYKNVAGIEIENSLMADVYQNNAYNNTGGILIFDLPGLLQKKGGNVRIYDNTIRENNFKNFAPKGNIVAKVPPGTGAMVLATNNVEIFNNRIINNKTANTGIISYFMTEKPITDSTYYPYPTSIFIHDNKYERKRMKPATSNKLGILFFLKFGRKVPDILYDGIVDPKTKNEDGSLKQEYRICIKDNSNATFANLDAANKFKNLNRNIQAYNCEIESLKETKLSKNE